MKELPRIFAYKLAAQRQWDGTGEASDVPRQEGDVWELCLALVHVGWMKFVCNSCVLLGTVNPDSYPVEVRWFGCIFNQIIFTKCSANSPNDFVGPFST